MGYQKRNDSEVLVTGGGGFIGSHLVERLVRDGVSVRAFLRYNSRASLGLLSFVSAKILDEVEVVHGDLRDGEAIRAAMKGCHVVIHLGALIAIPYSYVHPREVVDTNVMGTLNVLMAARDLEVERLVHTSTSEVYGTAQYTPIDEAHPLQGQSPYSASKIGADKIVESFYKSFEVPVVTIRPFNAYGPRQSARAVIPTIISQALAQNEIRLGDLSPTRDFTYVSDTVDGFIRAAHTSGIEGLTINIGANRAISIGDLVKKIILLIGRDIDVKTDAQRFRPEKSEVRSLMADNRLARNLLGWSPDVTLNEGLQRTIDWVAANPDYYRRDHYHI